ncbi:hypothetical protein [Burkholderia gladioli]|uniref:hypothetical protein n=1 Tax=Burkholderia gladioli TaxID=28095 RepID=UPI001640AC52|nr:hypothetical protein [Burkholderia gladioli]
MAITILKRTLCCTLLTVGSPVFLAAPRARRAKFRRARAIPRDGMPCRDYGASLPDFNFFVFLFEIK